MIPCRIKLWGKTIGAVEWLDSRNIANFEYEETFASTSGIQLSPLVMPLKEKKVYSFPELSQRTFHGLPGMLADSLPDKFGNALINAWLAEQGRPAESLNSVERLCYIGKRGMGALEFFPEIGPKQDKSKILSIDNLVELASEILTKREKFTTSFFDKEKSEVLRDILRVGTSAGGARAKAIIAWNEDTNEVRSGQINPGEGFSYWILKFDGVSGNKDKELEDPKGYGLIEYAYSILAGRAGIAMNECRIMNESNRNHFMTKRFDRTARGKKLHMQSLCAIAHYDFNMAGAYSYEQALAVMRKLGLKTSEIEEQFRRMVFNIVCRNQDDHVKNIAFLMNRKGNWSLSPAFDMTYSYNPEGMWTNNHQMSLNGKVDNFELDDFKLCASNASMKKGRAIEILDQVQTAASEWKSVAKDVGVPKKTRDSIFKSYRYFTTN